MTSNEEREYFEQLKRERAKLAWLVYAAILLGCGVFWFTVIAFILNCIE